MSNLLFTEVPLEQQETISGGRRLRSRPTINISPTININLAIGIILGSGNILAISQLIKNS